MANEDTVILPPLAAQDAKLIAEALRRGAAPSALAEEYEHTARDARMVALAEVIETCANGQGSEAEGLYMALLVAGPGSAEHIVCGVCGGRGGHHRDACEGEVSHAAR